MHLHLEFQYTFEELKAAQAAHAKQAQGRGGFLRGIIGWVMFVGLAVCLFILRRINAPPTRSAAPRPNLPADLFGNRLVFLACVGAFIAAFVFFVLRNRRDGRRRFEREPLLQQLQTIDITDAGITHGSRTTSTFYRWDAFHKHVETPDFFLLYISDAVFEMLPKRAFPAQAEMHEFREFVARVVSPPQYAFPVQPPKA
jgi:hypothetical protein